MIFCIFIIMMLVIFENLHSVESRRALYKLPQQGLGQS